MIFFVLLPAFTSQFLLESPHPRPLPLPLLLAAGSVRAATNRVLCSSFAEFKLVNCARKLSAARSELFSASLACLSYILLHFCGFCGTYLSTASAPNSRWMNFFQRSASSPRSWGEFASSFLSCSGEVSLRRTGARMRYSMSPTSSSAGGGVSWWVWKGGC